MKFFYSREQYNDQLFKIKELKEKISDQNLLIAALRKIISDQQQDIFFLQMQAGVIDDVDFPNKEGRGF